MIVGLMALCIVLMLAFPETPMARWLNTVLVEQPLAWLAKIRRRDIIFLFVAAALLLVAGDFIMLFGVSDVFAIGASLSIYFDAVLVTALGLPFMAFSFFDERFLSMDEVYEWSSSLLLLSMALYFRFGWVFCPRKGDEGGPLTQRPRRG